MQHNNVDSESEVDRLREYERRIYAARKAGFHVGNLSSRILDHWHRMGWYNVFFQRHVSVLSTYTPPGSDAVDHHRWNGDPGVRRPPGRARTMGPPSTVPMLAQVPEEPHIEPAIRNEGPPVHDHAVAGPSHDRTYEHDHHPSAYPTHDPGESMPSPPHTPSTVPANQQYAGAHGYAVSTAAGPTTVPGPVDQNMANFATMAQTMMSACMRLLQAQSEDSKIRLEYLRRREEREEEESRVRADAEKRRQEREAAEWERLQRDAKVKQRSELATELLSNPSVDGGVRQAAGEYLKKLFAND